MAGGRRTDRMHQPGPKTGVLHSTWAAVDEAVSHAPQEAADATALATRTRMAWNMRRHAMRAPLGNIVLIA